MTVAVAALVLAAKCYLRLPQGGWQGSTRKERLPADWLSRRAVVLARQPMCRDGRVCGGRNRSVQCDHIVPGDDHGYGNLQGICEPCHRAKSSSEGGTRMRARQPKRARAREGHPGRRNGPQRSTEAR